MKKTIKAYNIHGESGKWIHLWIDTIDLTSCDKVFRPSLMSNKPIRKKLQIRFEAKINQFTKPVR